MRAKMSIRTHEHERIETAEFKAALGKLAVIEARAILAETEPTETDPPFGPHLVHHCIRTIPADVRSGWWGDDERTALAESLAAFVEA